jgi:hypothetical protein
LKELGKKDTMTVFIISTISGQVPPSSLPFIEEMKKKNLAKVEFVIIATGNSAAKEKYGLAGKV